MRFLRLLLSLLFITAGGARAGLPAAGKNPASGHWEVNLPGLKDIGIQCSIDDDPSKDGQWLIFHCKAVMTPSRGAGKPGKKVSLEQDVNILVRNREVVAGDGDLYQYLFDGIRFAMCMYMVPVNDHQLRMYYVAYASIGKAEAPHPVGITQISDPDWRPDYNKSIWSDGDFIGSVHIVRTILIEKKRDAPR